MPVPTRPSAKLTVGLVLGGSDVAGVQAPVVEPVDPLQGRDLDVLQRPLHDVPALDGRERVALTLRPFEMVTLRFQLRGSSQEPRAESSTEGRELTSRHRRFASSGTAAPQDTPHDAVDLVSPAAHGLSVDDS